MYLLIFFIAVGIGVLSFYGFRAYTQHKRLSHIVQTVRRVLDCSYPFKLASPTTYTKDFIPEVIKFTNDLGIPVAYGSSVSKFSRFRIVTDVPPNEAVTFYDVTSRNAVKKNAADCNVIILYTDGTIEGYGEPIRIPSLDLHKYITVKQVPLLIEAATSLQNTIRIHRTNYYNSTEELTAKTMLQHVTNTLEAFRKTNPELFI